MRYKIYKYVYTAMKTKGINVECPYPIYKVCDFEFQMGTSGFTSRLISLFGMIQLSLFVDSHTRLYMSDFCIAICTVIAMHFYIIFYMKANLSTLICKRQMKKYLFGHYFSCIGKNSVQLLFVSDALDFKLALERN